MTKQLHAGRCTHCPALCRRIACLSALGSGRCGIGVGTQHLGGESRRVMKHAYLLYFCFLTLASSAVPPSSLASALCADADLLGPAVDLIRGKHLRVAELHWPPFAFRDSSRTPYGWGGFDIELLTEVAHVLGFTFEILEAELHPGETYTELLTRTVNECDLWASWWLRNEPRMNAATMLSGHVETSPLLIAGPVPPPEETPLAQTLFVREPLPTSFCFAFRHMHI